MELIDKKALLKAMSSVLNENNQNHAHIFAIINKAPTVEQDNNPLLHIGTCDYLIAEQAWHARAEIADKENAELKQMYEGAKRLLEFNTQKNPLLKEIAELQAQINELREALEKVIFHAEFREQDEDTARAVAIGQLIVIEELANEYLAKTAPQCLQEHDDEVIERCAKVCDEIGKRDQFTKITASAFAHEIRALKGK